MAVERSKAFDYAQDVTKQVLTLSTAVVTITVAFLKDIAQGSPGDARFALFAAWGLFALAILCGVATLLNLTGRVGAADETGSRGINAGGIRIFAIVQLGCFVLAIAGTIYFGARSFDVEATRCVVKTTQTMTTTGTETTEERTDDC